MNTFKNSLKALAVEYIKTGSSEIRDAALAMLRGGLTESDTVRGIKNKIGITALLGRNSSAKTIKGLKKGYDTYIMYLAPAMGSGANFCPNASDGCRLACLVGSGRMPMSSCSVSRLIKSWLFTSCNRIFLDVLRSEINAAIRRSDRTGVPFAIRLNGTSDLSFHGIVSEFPSVQWYDYTKMPSHLGRAASNQNYTFSYAEDNWAACRDAYRAGFNLAMPVTKEAHTFALSLPGCYEIDSTDLRFLDREENKKNRIGVLTAKVGKGLQGGIDRGFIADADRVRAFVEFVTA